MRPKGHCDSDNTWDEFSSRPEYTNPTRDRLAMGHLTDFNLANAIFLADRNSLELISYQTAAKERIRWLSIQLATALDRYEKLAAKARGIGLEIEAHTQSGCACCHTKDWAHELIGEKR
jgi:hypothetical protein